MKGILPYLCLHYFDTVDKKQKNYVDLMLCFVQFSSYYQRKRMRIWSPVASKLWFIISIWRISFMCTRLLLKRLNSLYRYKYLISYEGIYCKRRTYFSLDAFLTLYNVLIIRIRKYILNVLMNKNGFECPSKTKARATLQHWNDLSSV